MHFQKQKWRIPMIKKLIKNVIYAIIFVCIIGALCIFSTTFVSQRVDVNGNSMNPTLFNNDSLWLNKLTYYFQNPKRFDIVVIDTDLNGGEYIIKRIIGLPGDTIQIKNQKVYINGKRLQTDIYGKEPIEDAGTAANLMVLGKNEYFVLGDNRNDSDDSRFPEVGVIKKNRIIGKTSFRLLPIKNIGKLN